MLVEGHPDTAAAIKSLLNFIGHTATLCANFKSATKWLENDSCDLVLINIGSGEDFAYSFVLNAAKQHNLSTAGYAIGTGRSYRSEAFSAGCIGYIANPTDRDALSKAMDRLEKMIANRNESNSQNDPGFDTNGQQDEA